MFRVPGFTACGRSGLDAGESFGLSRAKQFRRLASHPVRSKEKLGAYIGSHHMQQDCWTCIYMNAHKPERIGTQIHEHIDA